MNPKIKNVFVSIIGLLVLLFVTVYMMSFSGYYDSTIEKKKTLTEEAVERFEKDVLNGEVIVASNYMEEVPTYDNLLSRLGIKFGNILEKIFHKIMSAVLKEIEGAIQ